MKRWIPLAVAISAIYFAVYVITQQTIRVSANDPQIALSEYIANEIAVGRNAENFLPFHTELSQSISPFVIIYDGDGHVILSTATLYGEMPQVPEGVLMYAKTNTQNRITWQPQKGIREAIVVTYFKGKTSGYILAGRSLRETEKREDMALKLSALGWIGTLFASLVATFLFTGKFSKN